MAKLIIMDFDGVIADTIHLAIRTANNMLEGEGYSKRVGVKELRERGLKGLTEEARLPVYKVPLYIRKSHGIFSREAASVKIFPGMKEALAKMKKRRKLAIVTSNSNENVNLILKNNGMGNVFDFIIAGVDVFGKASKMKKAVKAAGTDNEEAVCVGDEVRDIEAARKAGLRIIAVSWGFNSKNLLERNKPDYVAESPDELLELIKGI